MPLTHLIATRLGKQLTDVRKDGSIWWLRPDVKTHITIEYVQKADGSVAAFMAQHSWRSIHPSSMHPSSRQNHHNNNMMN